MLPISYDKDCNLDFYSEFREKFRNKIEKCLKKNCIYRNKHNENLNNDTRVFWTFLKTGDNLENLFECLPENFETIITEFESKYRKVLKKNTIIYKQTHQLFVGYGYNNFPKAELIRVIDTHVCPYCNRNFVSCVDNDDGSAPIKGQLDHFYSKEDYPFLALSRFNLVPSCSDCNGPSGKFRENARTLHLVSPYRLKNTHGLKFKMNIKGSKFANLSECEEAIEIEVKETNGSGLDANISAFHLKEVYNTHRDYAAEIYFKGKLRMPQIYRQKVLKALHGKGMNATDSDFVRLMLGFDPNQDNLNKRPMSKFLCDIAEDQMLL